VTTLVPDTLGALRVGPALLLEGAPGGPLSGRTFVAKDLLDVAGYATGAGNPDWLAEAVPAERSAPAVERVVAAGADLIGKSHTDELAYSLSGTNAHYGTPVNPAAPGRIPGGSSSGSAAAVAGHLCDVALGTDTGGSVRVPASYCGLYGLRPSHGRVPAEGLVPLARSFDVVGWFARDAASLATLGQVLLDPADPPPPARRLLVATDVMAEADPEAAAALMATLDTIGLPVEPVVLAPGGLDRWVLAFRHLQAAEAWAAHGAWLTASPRRMGADIRERFEWASQVGPEQVAAAEPVRREVRARIDDLLGDGSVLAVPSAAGVAPEIVPAGGEGAVADLRVRTLRITSAAGLAGAPAVSLPLAEVVRRPVGLCLVAAPGGDERLLDLAGRPPRPA
jgi:Asp-tRNA(Asn)/Glu-tRNA(Gln) amidotransferase A subunit family amidase